MNAEAARAPPQDLPAPLASLLRRAGVQVNGDAPWHLQLNDAAAWSRMLRHGVLGFGKSRTDGQWGCEQHDALVWRRLRAEGGRVMTLQSRCPADCGRRCATAC